MKQGMDRPAVWPALLALLLVAGLAIGGVASFAGEKDIEKHPGWKDITLIYTTDVKGKIDPCG